MFTMLVFVVLAAVTVISVGVFALFTEPECFA